MKLTPEMINAKNPANVNDICNAIRDFFLANATCKPICMACDLEPVEHSSEPALAGLIVFRVSKTRKKQSMNTLRFQSVSIRLIRILNTPATGSL